MTRTACAKVVATLLALGAQGIIVRDATSQVPAAAPDIVLIMLDDVGFADTSTFGGFAETPALDRLAAEGLRYNRFHTAAVCSPTRAALLSGRNHHRVGYGAFGGVDHSGYDGLWKKSTASVADVLRRNGYSTAAFGKWHNTPLEDISAVGPFDRWPTGLGFEYFYGNLLGISSQWEPALWRNTQMVAPPSTPEQGYHFTTDITDEAIRWINTHETLAPDKPYFLYFATGAAHDPHHAPQEWIRRYRGRFDRGWDRLRAEIFAKQKKLGVIPADAVLTPRPAVLPAWQSLSREQKLLFARQMEIYAAFIAHTDHEIGRLIQAVKQGARAQNTLILFIVGDNGPEAGEGIASPMRARAELQILDELGGPKYMNGYASGWAWMGSTPFQWTKQAASHFGGTRNPLVVSWPARIKDPGGLRSQFAHVNDIAATLYDAAGISFPQTVDGVKQVPLDGVSFVDTLVRADAPEHHRVQYFEVRGNRAIYQDGWMAAALHGLPGYRAAATSLQQSDFTADRWELYHVDEDFSQARDLASRYPQKLKMMQALFDSEARRNDIYPLGADSYYRGLPGTKGKRKLVFKSGFPTAYQYPAGDGLAPWDLSQPHRISVDVLIPESGTEGVLLSWGTSFGGIVLFIADNRLRYQNNVNGEIRETLTSDRPIPRGRVSFSFVMQRNGANRQPIGEFFINGSPSGKSVLTPNSVPFWKGIFDIGKNSTSQIGQGFEPPFAFTGKIESLTVELTEETHAH